MVVKDEVQNVLCWYSTTVAVHGLAGGELACAAKRPSCSALGIKNVLY